MTLGGVQNGNITTTAPPQTPPPTTAISATAEDIDRIGGVPSTTTTTNKNCHLIGRASDNENVVELQQQNQTIDNMDLKKAAPTTKTKHNAKQNDATITFLRAARSGDLTKVKELLDNGQIMDINTCNANGLNALHLAAKDGYIDIVAELLRRDIKVDNATKKGNTALHIASLAGQKDVIMLLLQYNANVNVQSLNGFTPLYMAAQENHDVCVRFLLAKGANPSLATEDGFTPLAVAMQQGHEKVVAVLLESDVRGKVRLPALHIAAKKNDVNAAALLLQKDQTQPDIVSKSGFTPLHIAAHYGNVEIATLLINCGANVNYMAKHNITPLHVACKWGKTNILELLLAHKAIIDATTRDGLTPLHCAARSGHVEVIEILLAQGAPIMLKTKNGLAPLHMAAQGEHEAAAHLLLKYNAKVDEVTVDYLTALHVAAHCGHVRVSKLLLDYKADPNARALNGFTPLHIACKKNRIKVVELLLKYDATIGATTESGLTPLHVASFMGCMNIVIYLLQHDANPDVATVRGETPLHLAARANQTDIIRILLRYGAQVDARAREGQTPLHVAARMGNTDIVMLLLQHGANVNATTKDLYTALHIAAKEGQDDVVQLLLENDTQVECRTKKGFTALHLAAKYGKENVTKQLLARGAEINCQGKNDVTPLHVATHYDHQNVVQLLLEQHASPQLCARNGHSALHVAAKKNQLEIAQMLLQYGADPDVRSKAGFSPMHLAAQEGNLEMVQLLLEHNVDVNCQARNGLTPLHLCAQEDRDAVANVLLQHNANIAERTKTGYTPLHVAAHYGHINMVKFLLEHDANIEMVTNIGYTPLHQAAQQGHTVIINLLLRHRANPDAVTSNGHTALNIANNLGYVTAVESLKPVTTATLTSSTTSTTITTGGGGVGGRNGIGSDEKYQVVAPEQLHESFPTDSEDEGSDEPIEDQQQYNNQYKYMANDDLKTNEQEQYNYNYDTMHHTLNTTTGSAASGSVATGANNSITFTNYQVHQQQPRINGNNNNNNNINNGNGNANNYNNSYNINNNNNNNNNNDQVDCANVEDEIDIEHIGNLTAEDDIVGRKVHALNTSNYNQQNLDGGSSNYINDKRVDNIAITRPPVHLGFLVSFLVDARGGSMRGCRHSGVRIIVPPKACTQPTRITCRYVKPQRVHNPPPLMEGEALVSRILELSPVEATFLSPVTLEVPHFGALRDKEREIIILRSDNGETWREHSSYNNNVDQQQRHQDDAYNLSGVGDGIGLDITGGGGVDEVHRLDELHAANRIIRIVTRSLPHFFAVVSRIRQEVHTIGPDGGTISSQAVPMVQAIFPPNALTKKIRVGLQAQPIVATDCSKRLGQGVAVSPVVTVEPRRRKFHKAITLSIPAPKASNQSMINSPYNGNAPTLRLLCSITGGQNSALWEDVTGSTPLSFVNESITFTTTVSARFWLMDCRQISEASAMATELYTHMTHVPFMVKFVVYAKRLSANEAKLSIFCMTDDKEDKTLEQQDHFQELAKSCDVEVLSEQNIYLEFGGGLVPVLKSGEQLNFTFHAFRENRLSCLVYVKDPELLQHGRVSFMAEPKVSADQPVQRAICTLQLPLGKQIVADPSQQKAISQSSLNVAYNDLIYSGFKSPVETITTSKLITHNQQSTPPPSPSQQLGEQQNAADDIQNDVGNIESDAINIHSADIRLNDLAKALGDVDNTNIWLHLAEELEIPQADIDLIEHEYATAEPKQKALVMLRLWQRQNGSHATGNKLEQALQRIGCNSIIQQCLLNMQPVVNLREHNIAQQELQQTNKQPNLHESLNENAQIQIQKVTAKPPTEDHIKNTIVEHAVQAVQAGNDAATDIFTTNLLNPIEQSKIVIDNNDHYDNDGDDAIESFTVSTVDPDGNTTTTTTTTITKSITHNDEQQQQSTPPPTPTTPLPPAPTTTTTTVTSAAAHPIDDYKAMREFATAYTDEVLQLAQQNAEKYVNAAETTKQNQHQ